MNTKRLMTALILATLMLSMFSADASAKGKPTDPGGHTEPAGNNLSFPVIWSEGVSLTIPAEVLPLTVPYTDPPVETCPTVNIDGVDVTPLAYAQKTVGNAWQAENLLVNPLVEGNEIYVDEIDWGDSLESVDMKVGRPVRVELSLYKLLDIPMVGYTMVMLANPSSPDEVQGVCALDNGNDIVTYDSYEATVYTPDAVLIIQKIVPDEILTWDPVNFKWYGASEPISISFAGELNVGGKIIYGLSEGGWRPETAGVYRITFYMPTDGNTLFDEGTAIRGTAEAGGTAYVDPLNNLTYIDVQVVAGGGGGGGKPKP